MAWTYSGNPSTSEKDAVRFEVGDIDITDQLLQDAEIMYSLSVAPSVLGAAVRCCEALARRFARQADIRLGPQSISASQRSQAYRELAKDLRSRMMGMHAPYAGNISIEDYQRDRMDTSIRKPAFERDLMTNPSLSATPEKSR